MRFRIHRQTPPLPDRRRSYHVRHARHATASSHAVTKTQRPAPSHKTFSQRTPDLNHRHPLRRRGRHGRPGGWATDARFPLPRDVAPGESVSLSQLLVVPPSSPGAYTLRHRLLKEGTGPGANPAWFDDILKSPVTVGQSLTVARNQTGAGTIISDVPGIACGTDCAQGYAGGQVVVLTAAPASGSTFAGWSGACAGTVPTCSLTIDAAKEASAAFTASNPTNRPAAPSPSPIP